MTGSFADWRMSDRERARTRGLFDLIPKAGKIALDIGARDGYFSKLLAERFDHVVALDLEKPDIDHRRIEPVKGDASHLDFDDNTFELVLCAEVLEHIPPHLLEQVCSEIVRVTNHVAVIGVPYKQDIRLGRTTCQACGKVSPPYGHVNTFDEDQLEALFKGTELTRVSYVGSNTDSTNAISAALMDFAGNPYGTYEQEEHCLWCDSELRPPTYRTLMQKVATKLALVLNNIQRMFLRPRANWIHIRLEKKDY